jgi:hypothetical protein
VSDFQNRRTKLYFNPLNATDEVIIIFIFNGDERCVGLVDREISEVNNYEEVMTKN